MFKSMVAMLMVGLMAAVGGAQASETLPAPDRIELKGGYALVFTPFAVIQGQPGEPQEVTINRAAQALQAFTADTGTEGCGDIAIGPGDVFRIVLGSNRSHIGCVSRQGVLPEGYTWVNETIHSHPDRHAFMVNSNDVAANSAAQSEFPMLRVGQAMELDARSHTFSPTDLLATSGYLVANGQLLYHRKSTNPATQAKEDKIYQRGAVASLEVSPPTQVAVTP